MHSTHCRPCLPAPQLPFTSTTDLSPALALALALNWSSLSSLVLQLQDVDCNPCYQAQGIDINCAACNEAGTTCEACADGFYLVGVQGPERGAHALPVPHGHAPAAEAGAAAAASLLCLTIRAGVQHHLNTPSPLLPYLRSRVPPASVAPLSTVAAPTPTARAKP